MVQIIFDQNISMKTFFLLLAVHFCAISWGQTQSEDFQIRRQNLENRFEDYYTRKVLIERYLLQRDRGADEVSKERQKLAAEYEKARLDFVAQRKKTPRPDSRLHEQELLERRRQYEKMREEYVQQMRQLQKLEKEYAIPGEEELGVELNRENL